MSDPDFSHYITDVDSDLAEWVGQFMVAWGRLEYEIDCLFPIVFRFDPTLSLCITANLGTKAKIDMLRSAINMIAPALPEDLIEEANELFILTNDLTGQKRNLIAHGQPFVFSDSGEQCWEWVRVVARKNLSLLLPDTNADFWRVATGSVYIVIEGYRECAGKLHKIVFSLSDEEWEKVCVVREENRSIS